MDRLQLGDWDAGRPELLRCGVLWFVFLVSAARRPPDCVAGKTMKQINRQCDS